MSDLCIYHADEWAPPSISFIVDPQHPAAPANYSCADIRSSVHHQISDIAAPVSCYGPYGLPDLKFTFTWSSDLQTVGRELHLELDVPKSGKVLATKSIPDWQFNWIEEPAMKVIIEMYVGPPAYEVEVQAFRNSVSR